jgi:hypothetical protein
MECVLYSKGVGSFEFLNHRRNLVRSNIHKIIPTIIKVAHTIKTGEAEGSGRRKSPYQNILRQTESSRHCYQKSTLQLHIYIRFSSDLVLN